MYDDGAAANGRRRVGGVVGAHLVVVDDLVCGPVPDFDAEPVHVPAAVLLPVAGRQQKAVLPASVDRTRTLELELGLAGRGGGPLLVARDEAKAGLARQRRIGCISPGRRVDPAATGGKAAAREVYVISFHS
jgi:hypothetical protein